MSIKELINFLKNHTKEQILSYDKISTKLLMPILKPNARKLSEDSYISSNNFNVPVTNNLNEWIFFLNDCQMEQLNIFFEIIKKHKVDFELLFCNLKSVCTIINLLEKLKKKDKIESLLNLIVGEYFFVFTMSKYNSALNKTLNYFNGLQIKTLVSNLPVDKFELFISSLIFLDGLQNPFKEIFLLEEIKACLIQKKIDGICIDKNDYERILEFINAKLVESYEILEYEIKEDSHEFLKDPVVNSIWQSKNPSILANSFNKLVIENSMLFIHILHANKHVIFKSALFLGNFLKYLELDKISIFLNGMKNANRNCASIFQSSSELRGILSLLNAEQIKVIIDLMFFELTHCFKNPISFANILNVLNEEQIKAVLINLKNKNEDIFSNIDYLDILIYRLNSKKTFDIYSGFISKEVKKNFSNYKTVKKCYFAESYNGEGSEDLDEHNSKALSNKL